MSKFWDKAKAIREIITDKDPSHDESHAATRYGIYEPEIIPDLPTPQETIDQRFDTRVAKHPEYSSAIFAKINDHISKGETYLSMRDIFGELRGAGLAINNDFSSRYTDMLIEFYPELEQYFHRRARAKGKMARHYV